MHLENYCSGYLPNTEIIYGGRETSQSWGKAWEMLRRWLRLNLGYSGFVCLLLRSVVCLHSRYISVFARCSAHSLLLIIQQYCSPISYVVLLLRLMSTSPILIWLVSLHFFFDLQFVFVVCPVQDPLLSFVFPTYYTTSATFRYVPT